jgi:prepilin-type N-terminal cleavage/methylation domain-containing protein
MNAKSPRSIARRHSAFTLIELLVVIAIIAILAGLLIQTAGFVQEKAGRVRAESEIKAIEAGLENYKLDFGSYPAQADAGANNSTKVLIQELALYPITKAAEYGNRKPFEFPIKMLDGYKSGSGDSYDVVLGKSSNLIDPFGNPYHYQFDPSPTADNSDRSGNGSYNIWSQGKKNSSEEKLWIKNW